MPTANLVPKNNNALFFVSQAPVNSGESFSTVVSSMGMYSDFVWKGRARVTYQTRNPPHVYESIRFWWGYDETIPNDYYQFAIWPGQWEMLLNYNGSTTTLGTNTDVAFNFGSWIDFEISRSVNTHTVKINGVTVLTFTDSTITGSKRLAFSGLDCKIDVDYVSNPTNDTFDDLATSSTGAGPVLGNWSLDWLGTDTTGTGGIETLYQYSFKDTTLTASAGVPIINADLSKGLSGSTLSSTSKMGTVSAALTKSFSASTLSSQVKDDVTATLSKLLSASSVTSVASNGSVSFLLDSTLGASSVTSTSQSTVSATVDRTIPSAGVSSTATMGGVSAILSKGFSDSTVTASGIIGSRVVDLSSTLAASTLSSDATSGELTANLSKSFSGSTLTSSCSNPIVAVKDSSSNKALFFVSAPPSGASLTTIVRSTSIYGSFSWKGRARVESQTRTPPNVYESIRFWWARSPSAKNDFYQFAAWDGGWDLSVTVGGTTTSLGSGTNVRVGVKKWFDFDISRTGNVHTVKVDGVTIASFTNSALTADGYLSFSGLDCRIEVDYVDAPVQTNFDAMSETTGPAGSVYGQWYVDWLGDEVGGGSSGIVTVPTPSMMPALLAASGGAVSRLTDLNKTLSASTVSSGSTSTLVATVAKSLAATTLASDVKSVSTTGSLSKTFASSTLSSNSSMGGLNADLSKSLSPTTVQAYSGPQMITNLTSNLSASGLSSTVIVPVKCDLSSTLLPASSSAGFDAIVHASADISLNASSLLMETTTDVTANLSKSLAGSTASGDFISYLDFTSNITLSASRVKARIVYESIDSTPSDDRMLTLDSLESSIKLYEDRIRTLDTQDRVFVTTFADGI